MVLSTSAEPGRQPRLSVIVPTRDRPDFLEDALQAVERAVGRDDEVIVADSASRSGATRRVVERFGARYVRCAEPGASRARNAGMRASAAPIVAFTDDDCRPCPGWGDALARALEDVDTDFVTGPVRSDRADGPALSVIEGATARTFLGADTDLRAIGHGANMAVRRAAMDAIGGFDEGLGAGGRFRGSEDQDVFWRLLRAGRRGRFEPAAAVVHHQWRDRRGVWRAQFGYGVGSAALAAKRRRVGDETADPDFWRSVLRTIVRDVRRRHAGAALNGASRLLGVVVGTVTAKRAEISEARFVVE